MIYLLDTDTLIFMLRGFRAKVQAAARQQARGIASRCRERQAAGDAVGISAITVAELEYGARRSDH